MLVPAWEPGVGIIPQPNSLFVYSLQAQRFDVFSAETILHIEALDGIRTIEGIAASICTRFPGMDSTRVIEDVRTVVEYLGRRGYVSTANNVQATAAPIEFRSSADRVKAVHADIELTRNCNLSCSYCYAAAGRSHDDLAGPKWIQKLQTLRDAGLRAVVVSGGEPTMHPDFLEIFTFCCDTFLTTLNSNGYRIDQAMAHRLAQLQVQTVQISLDSDRPDEHDAQRGRGAWKRAVSAVMNLVSEGVPTRVSCVVHTGNVDRVEAVSALIHSLGAEPVFDIMKPVGRAQSKKESDFLSSALQVVQANPVPEVYRMMQAMEIRCQAQLGFVGISSRGNLKPCNLTEDFFNELSVAVVNPIEEDFAYDQTGAFRLTDEACSRPKPVPLDSNPLTASCIFQQQPPLIPLLTRL